MLQPQFGEKLQAVQCDIEKEGFGLDQHTLNTLHDEVNVFFHCAATLRFNEELRFVYTSIWLFIINSLFCFFSSWDMLSECTYLDTFLISDSS